MEHTFLVDCDAELVEVTLEYSSSGEMSEYPIDFAVIGSGDHAIVGIFRMDSFHMVHVASQWIGNSISSDVDWGKGCKVIEKAGTHTKQYFVPVFFKKDWHERTGYMFEPYDEKFNADEMYRRIEKAKEYLLTKINKTARKIVDLGENGEPVGQLFDKAEHQRTRYKKLIAKARYWSNKRHAASQKIFELEDAE